MGKISKLLISIILIIIVLTLTSCTLSKDNNKIENVDNSKIIDNNIISNNNKTNDETSSKLDNNSTTQKYTFDKHGPIDDKNSKFNPNTGDVLYIASNIYPPYKQEENNPNDYDFLSGDPKKIEHKYDETEKFLYLRNIYTQEMFLVDKIDPNNEQNYTYDFTKDNQIEINGKIIKEDIKTQKNLVYAECNSIKSDHIKKDSDVINNALKIDEEVANKILSHIKDNYNIDSEIMFTLTYNNVSYAVVNIPDNFIDFTNSYKKISTLDSYSSSIYKDKKFTLELWKYENGNCKRLLYNHFNFSIYNIVNNKGCIMILGRDEYPGFIIKFNKNSDILYEAKFQGFSKSPDGRYTLIYNKDDTLTVIENDKVIINYNFFGNDSMNTFWQTGPTEIKYFWDLEFNKLYIFLYFGITPMHSVYCVDLEYKEIKFYDNVKLRFYQSNNVHLESGYIFVNNSPNSLVFDPEQYCADLFTYKKFDNYLYNLRTNEKIYLANKAIYSFTEVNNNIIIYNQTSKQTWHNGEIKLEPIELKIDISQYINKNRINYLKEIKKSVINSYDKNINEENIELCLIFNSNSGSYQIVKINESNKHSYYELWKINYNNYEKLFNKTDKIFLTNNQEYLCTVSKNGELKIYDKNFDCIINENIYSENLLNRYNLESLEISHYYVMKFDKNIFITIKDNENLVDVVNIDLVNNKILSIDYELNCNYNNYFINPENGYLVYQTGPSIVKYDEFNKIKIANSTDLKDFFTAINLINMEKKTITKDELEIYVYN